MLALIVAGCAGLAAGSSEPRQPAPPPAADIAGAATEPAGWAALASARCGPLDFDVKGACYDEALMGVLAAHGTRAAMETLALLGAADADLGHHGHVLAHHVGIAAYRTPDEVGSVFAECTPIFQSGCYHGVIQAYFADAQATTSPEGIGAERLNRLCQNYRGNAGNRWLLFQCVHGIGHGLVALHDNHLPRALAGCDMLVDEWEREGCYGGAFMENVVSATMPHHAPRPDQNARGHTGAHAHAEHHAHHDHQGAHSHAGHGHEHHAHDAGSVPTTEAFKALDPADPHYPCSALDERYLYSCYTMQTSAVLFWAGGDVTAGIRLCDGAPERVRQTCYVSLGRDINSYTQQNHPQAIARCMEVTETFQPYCVIGVAKNLIDITADPADGLAFCRALAAGQNRARCFQAVGEQIAVLEASPERRAALCQGLEGDDARACRFGAGVREDIAAHRPGVR
jgi:hypothetical protein